MKESIKPLSFIEMPTNKTIPPSCIDGRPDKKSQQGAQMPGASIFPSTIEAIINNKDFDAAFVENGLQRLKEAGFTIGVHRGHHKDAKQEKSDCGFIDKLPEIINTAKNNRAEISKRLNEIYLTENIDINSLSSSYDLLSNYNTSQIKIKGEPLIILAEKNKAVIEDLEGNHQEQAAFVNLKTNTTLNTRELNRQEQQAFNLDLWATVEQGSVLVKDVSTETLRNLSLIFYVATEMVLVELQGKPTLQVIIHK